MPDRTLKNLEIILKSKIHVFYLPFLSEIDDSNDYRLTADEIVACLKKIGRPMPKRIVLEQIRKFDVKQSGVLEFDEFLNFLSMNSKSGSGSTQASSTVCSIQ